MGKGKNKHQQSGSDEPSDKESKHDKKRKSQKHDKKEGKKPESSKDHDHRDHRDKHADMVNGISKGVQEMLDSFHITDDDEFKVKPGQKLHGGRIEYPSYWLHHRWAWLGGTPQMRKEEGKRHFEIKLSWRIGTIPGTHCIPYKPHLYYKICAKLKGGKHKEGEHFKFQRRGFIIRHFELRDGTHHGSGKPMFRIDFSKDPRNIFKPTFFVTPTFPDPDDDEKHKSIEAEKAKQDRQALGHHLRLFCCLCCLGCKGKKEQPSENPRTDGDSEQSSPEFRPLIEDPGSKANITNQTTIEKSQKDTAKPSNKDKKGGDAMHGKSEKGPDSKGKHPKKKEEVIVTLRSANTTERVFVVEINGYPIGEIDTAPNGKTCCCGYFHLPQPYKVTPYEGMNIPVMMSFAIAVMRFKFAWPRRMAEHRFKNTLEVMFPCAAPAIKIAPPVLAI